MWIYVVIDTDNNKLVKAFTDEFIASDFADDYYLETKNDCIVNPVYLRK